MTSLPKNTQSEAVYCGASSFTKGPHARTATSQAFFDRVCAGGGLFNLAKCCVARGDGFFGQCRLKVLMFVLCFFSFSCLAFADMAPYFDPSSVGSSASMIGMGYIQGFSPYANSVFENPASLYRTSQGSASVFSTKIMNEVNYYNCAAALRLKYGVVALGYMAMGVDDLIKTRINNDLVIFGDQGSYNYRNNFIKLGYQASIREHLHVGLNLNFYSLQMDTLTGKGSNVDLGMVLDKGFIETSFVLKNVLQSQKMVFSDSDTLSFVSGTNNSSGEKELLPLSWILSSKVYWRAFSFSAQFKRMAYYGVSLKSFGLEYHPSYFASLLRFSAGYGEYHTVQSLKNDNVDLTHVSQALSFGLGLTLFNVHFDYAFERGEHVVKSARQRHYFSLNFYF